MTDIADDVHTPEIVEILPLALYQSNTFSFEVPTGNSPIAVRDRIKILKEVTERCYMSLAKDLWDCYNRKLYIGYGFSTFNEYGDVEVGISKDRSYKLRRIFAIMCHKCGITPNEVETAERSRVEMILNIVDKKNAREWFSRAKSLPYKELRDKIEVERVSRRPPEPSATKPDKSSATTPIRLACESTQNSDPRSEEYHTRTFRMPNDADNLLDEALGVAQRVTGSHSDNFNLACIAQQFLAHNLTVEGKDDGRRGYFQRWMEEIYGGRFLHIKNDEAWEVLADAVKKHEHLFGESERELSNDRSNDIEHSGVTRNDGNDGNDGDTGEEEFES